jgi:hypothetical protein
MLPPKRKTGLLLSLIASRVRLSLSEILDGSLEHASPMR